MEQSILKSVKKTLGLTPSDDSFDEDVILHINSVFSILEQLGIGSDDGFMIEDDESTWDDFLGGDKRLSSVKTYVHLRVRLLFDPPGTSFALDAMKEQIQEIGWRLNVQREGEEWTDPLLLEVS